MIQQAFMTQSISTLPGGDGAITHATQPQPVDPATNRLSAATYDDAGNMTARSSNPDDSVYTWDSAGTMRSLTETNRELHFLYTADDERIAVASRSNVSTGFTTTWTPRGFSNQVLRTLVDDNSSGTHVWSWSGDEIWRGSSLVADVTPAGTRHFILDHLASPRLVTDMSSSANPLTNDFSPFGSGGTTGSGPLQFTGHERDFGNDNQRTLDYMHARYYSAAAGRFLSVDPVLGDARVPQSWNRYAYVLNNPTNHSDPTGKCGENADMVGPRAPCPPPVAPVSTPEPPPEPAPIDVFVFGSLTATTDTPVRPAAEGVGLVGYDSDKGVYAGVIGAGGVEAGSHENYIGAFKGFETTTASPTPTIIDLKEFGIGVEIPYTAGAGGGAGKYQTKDDYGVFAFASGGAIGEHGSVGVGVSTKPVAERLSNFLLHLMNLAYGGH